MRTVASVALVALLSYVGTMFDNFFAFAAQLVVTDPSRVRRVSVAQAAGVTTLVILAGGLATLLGAVPLRWVGVLSLAPFAFAWHAWRRRRPSAQFRRGVVTTFLITVALGGDSLAVWMVLLRADGVARSTITLATFAVCEVVFLYLARRVATHPRVVNWGARHAPTVTPFFYVALGVLILFECHVI